MKFKIKVKDNNDLKDWWEVHEIDTEDAQKWAEETIQRFNNYLRPGEATRTLLAVEIIESGNETLHRWKKNVFGMSVNFRGNNVDLMSCEKCGITGKRYGLNRHIILDSKFKKKIFQQCDTSKKEMGVR